MRALKKKTKPVARSMSNLGKTLELVAPLAFILALIVASAAFYGLYWGHHKSIFVLAVLSVLGLAVLVRRMLRSADGVSVADLLLVGVVCLYSVMVPFAATTLGAVNAALMWLSLLVTYLFFADAPPQAKRWLQAGLIMAGAVVALVGLLSYTGVIVVAGQMLGGRLAGAFHYPNTTASMLNMGLIAALFFRSSRRWIQGIASACVVLCATALVITMSRGGWIALLLTLFVSLWLKRRELMKFVALATITLGAGLIGAVAAMLTRSHIGLFAALGASLLAGALAETVTRASSRVVPVLALFVLSVGGAAGIYTVIAADTYTLANVGETPSWRQIEFSVAGLAAGEYRLQGDVVAEFNPPAPMAGQLSVWDVTTAQHTQLITHAVQESTTLDVPFVVKEGMQSIEVRLNNVHPNTRVVFSNPRIIGLADVRLSNVFHKVLPYDLAVRVSQGMRLGALAEDPRLIFMYDGLTAFRQAPIFGRGGGAWEATYSSVQSFLYGSRRAHADFIDFLLDIGAVGLVLLVSFLVLALRRVTSAKIEGTLLALGVSGISLIAHSFGEATIAFPVLYFWLFGILGALRSETESPLLWGKNGAVRVVGTAVLALSLATGIMVSALTVEADAVAAQAMAFDTARAREPATALYRQAVRLNPWHATRKADLALRIAEKPNTQGEQRRLIESALRLAPFDPAISSLAGSFVFAHGDYDEALKHYRRTITLQHKNPLTYTHAAFVASEAALTLMPIARAEGEQFALQAVEVYNDFITVKQSADPVLLKQGVVPFVAAADLRLEVGRALVLLGRVAEAKTHLHAALLSNDVAVDDKARVWLSRAYRAAGEQAQETAVLATVTNKALLESLPMRIDRALGR